MKFRTKQSRDDQLLRHTSHSCLVFRSAIIHHQDPKLIALIYNVFSKKKNERFCDSYEKSQDTLPFCAVHYKPLLNLKGKFTQKLFFDICFDIGLTSRK